MGLCYCQVVYSEVAAAELDQPLLGGPRLLGSFAAIPEWHGNAYSCLLSLFRMNKALDFYASVGCSKETLHTAIGMRQRCSVGLKLVNNIEVYASSSQFNNGLSREYMYIFILVDSFALTIDWVAYKQPRFIFHSSRVWEVQDIKVPADSVFGEGPLPAS